MNDRQKQILTAVENAFETIFGEKMAIPTHGAVDDPLWSEMIEFCPSVGEVSVGGVPTGLQGVEINGIPVFRTTGVVGIHLFMGAMGPGQVAEKVVTP